jgi:hypothetical protein
MRAGGTETHRGHMVGLTEGSWALPQTFHSNVLSPSCNSDIDSWKRRLIVFLFLSQGTLQKTPISFQSILEGTKHFHKDFLIGEGEIFEVYRVDIRNQAYAVKLFKQVRKESR